MGSKLKTINLALQGGGAHGARAWGILDKLLEDGRTKIDGISATSAGAMNAVVLAYGLRDGSSDMAREALHTFWKDISEAGRLYNPVKPSWAEQAMGVDFDHSMAYFFFSILTEIFSPEQLNPLNFNPLRDVLEKNVDFEALRKSKRVKLFLSATNVKTGKIKVFENQEITADAVLASACLPLLFPAVNIDNQFYWDGGYMGNPALFPLIYNCKSRDILIVHINPIYRDTVPVTAKEILNRLNEVSFNSSLLREMRAIAFITKMLDEGWLKKKYEDKMNRIYMHAIRADVAMQAYSEASKLNPDWPFLCDLFKAGRKECGLWLDQHVQDLGKRSSIDIEEYL